MSLLSKTKEAYGSHRNNGKGRFHSAIRAPFTGLKGAVKGRVKQEYQKGIDAGRRPIFAGATAVPAATKNYLVEKKDNLARDHAALGFVFFALLINFLFERYFPITRFNGFSLEFFKNTIFGGNWAGIYNIFHFNIYFLVIVFAIFNLRDRKPHTLRVWLSLILVTYLLSSIPILNTYMGMRNIIEFFMLFFTAIYLTFAKEVTWDDFMATITLFWVFYNLWAFGVTATLGGIIHFIFVVLFYLTFCMGKAFWEDRTQIKWWLLIIILFDFVLPEFFDVMYPNLPIATLPFLTFGVLLFAQVYQPSSITMFLIILFVAFYFFQATVAGGSFRDFINQRQADDAKFEDRKNPFSPAYWKDMMMKMMNQSLYYGSGQDYYASQVDENAKKRLGVYIDGLGKNPKEYYDNEEIVIDATLTAQNFVSEGEGEIAEPINIKLGCSAYQSNKEKEKGKIYPKKEFTIESYDVENIQCVFEPWQLEKGSYEIRLNAEFNFKTQAYLKRYFVAKETIDSLRRKQLIKKDTDILKLNDITDINPLVKNSVAPVQLKASDKIPVVIKLSSQVTTSHLFGLQLENSWKGKIEKIENIQFFLPEHIEIEKGRCTPFHMEKSLAPEAEGYSLFQMVYMNNPRLKNIERSVEQRCWILIKPENRDNILQPGDVTTRYFRMIADYTYGLEEKLKINVREEKGFSVRIASTDSKVLDSSSYVSCIVKNDEDIGDTVICTLFADSNEPESISTFCSDDTCKCDFFRPTDRKYPRGTSLRCDAKVEKKEYFSSAYAEVKNSPPEIKNIRMSQDSVRKGENIICSVDASDVDNDNIIVQFDFEGLNIASTQKECMGSCSVEIPTSNAIETTTLKCTAMAIDGKGDKSKELTAKAKVTVEAQNE